MTEKLTEEEIVKQFVEYVKEQKITVYADAETKTLHIFKTPKNAPWLKYDRKL